MSFDAAPGSVYGYNPAELHEASVQVTPVSHATVGDAGTVKSVFCRLLAPLVKGVLESMTFHPAPLPELSPISSVSVVVVV